MIETQLIVAIGCEANLEQDRVAKYNTIAIHTHRYMHKVKRQHVLITDV